MAMMMMMMWWPFLRLSIELDVEWRFGNNVPLSSMAKMR